MSNEQEQEQDQENTIDDLLADVDETVEVDPSYFAESPNASEIPNPPSMIACGIDTSLDVDLDLGDMMNELSIDKSKPLDIVPNPITGATICTANVSEVVAAFLSLSTLNQSLKVFETELRKAALNLATGTTKTRRLTAEVDGELQTLIVNLPDETWSEQELGAISAWVNRKENPAPAAVKQLYARCIREKPKVERSPIKKETKKLLSEQFPEGSELADLKERILRANKGVVGKLPSVKVEGDKMNGWEQKRFGDGEDKDE